LAEAQPQTQPEAAATNRHPAPLTADELAAMLRAKMARVKPYVPYGIEMNHGYDVDLAPVQNVYGDCRSQRLTFWLPHRKLPRPAVEPAAELSELRLTNRYRRPDWVEQREGARDCGAVDAAGWIVSPDDYSFYMAAKAYGRLRAAVLGGERPGFAITCQDFGPPCADPLAKLREVLRAGPTRLEWDRGTTTASNPVEGGGATWTLTFRGDREIQAVDLTFQVPPLS
jgi:hypothetical protein